MTRNVKGFNPEEYLKKGNSDTGEEISYLPAAARLMWFNLYNEQVMGNTMSLTTELTQERQDIIVYKAKLTMLLTDNNGNYYPFVIATGEGSNERTEYGYEMCETRAKARCLASAGFFVDKEKNSSVLDEGSQHVDGPPFVQNTTQPPSQGQSQDLPVLPPVVQNGCSDYEKLKHCLKSFFPYSPFKSQMTYDVVYKADFCDKIKWYAEQNFGKKIIDENLTINEYFKTLKRFLINASAEDRQMLIKCLGDIDNERSKQ